MVRNFVCYESKSYALNGSKDIKAKNRKEAAIIYCRMVKIENVYVNVMDADGVVEIHVSNDDIREYLARML